MSADNDPTEWSVATENQGKAQEAFEKAARGEHTPEQSEVSADQDQDSEPDKPFPRPRPHGMGEEAVDRQSFDNRWAQDQRRAQAMQEEALRQPAAPISDGFNAKADELGRAEHDVQAAQNRLNTLRSYAQPVNPSLDTETQGGADAFDRIDAQSQARGQDKGRGP